MNAGDPNDRHRAWHFRQLKWSVQALKLRVPDQLVLFPDIVTSVGELALQFDHWAEVIWENYGSELTDAESAALTALDRKIAGMLHDGAEFDAELWTDAGLRSNVHWDEVRALAADVLDAFGWSAESDPPGPPGAEQS